MIDSPKAYDSVHLSAEMQNKEQEIFLFSFLCFSDLVNYIPFSSTEDK